MNFAERNATVKDNSAYYSHGLRAFLLSVYSYMSGALCVTGIISYLIASSELGVVMYTTPLYWLIVLSPVILAYFLSSRIHTMSLSSAQTAFWAFAVLMGLSLSSVFLVYTGSSVARVFFISASMFGIMALYGNNTRRDLTSMGSFMMMGVFGVIVASLVNLFMQSEAIQFAVSLVSVVLFAGLTAYDMQKIKDTYYRLDSSGSVTCSKIAIMGALSLYLDFINIFVSLLHLMGDRK